jgi:endonuclease G
MDFHRAGQRFKQRRSRSVQGTQQNQFGELASTFPGRNGYDKNFLGTRLELPQVHPSMQDQVATLIGKPDETELTYTNFSIVMNKERRQPLMTAVNIDGANIVSVPRKGKWTIDSRIPREHQLGNEAYKHNPIDRGHMVRRRDPVWGPNPNQASNDTFAFTNAGLQHGSLNQKTWLDLENFILEQSQEKDMKLTVMTGPVFSPDDPSFNNNGRMSEPTQIPQEFWKVVVWNDSEEGLKGAAFIQSQKDYVGQGMFKTDFDPGEMSVYQMPLSDLEKVTKLDFGDIGDTASGTHRVRDAKDALL